MTAKKKRNVRDHGYGKSPDPKGPPLVGDPVQGICPNCGCGTLFPVSVELVEAPKALRVPEGSVPVGAYMGCPACPWASQMAVAAKPAVERLEAPMVRVENARIGWIAAVGGVVLDLGSMLPHAIMPVCVAEALAQKILNMLEDVETDESGEHPTEPN